MGGVTHPVKPRPMDEAPKSLTREDFKSFMLRILLVKSGQFTRILELCKGKTTILVPYPALNEHSALLATQPKSAYHLVSGKP